MYVQPVGVPSFAQDEAVPGVKPALQSAVVAAAQVSVACETATTSGVYVQPAPHDEGIPVMKAQSGSQVSAIAVPTGTQLRPQRTIPTAPQL
jgi:hypothetical protein